MSEKLLVANSFNETAATGQEFPLETIRVSLDDWGLSAAISHVSDVRRLETRGILEKAVVYVSL